MRLQKVTAHIFAECESGLLINVINYWYLFKHLAQISKQHVGR